MSNTKKKGGLGKGLSVLLTDAEGTSADYIAVGSVSHIPISKIQANPFQPRLEFEEEALRELSESISTHGVIQPITVRKMAKDKYQIISGERRTRASMIAGLDKIPAYVRVARDQEMLEMAIVENLHRENLNPFEIATSYQRLIDECNLKHEELSNRVNKDRSTVTNYLRLLKLPEEVQLALKEQEVSMGHAKTILSLSDHTDQLTLLKRIIDESLSVRKAEELTRLINRKEEGDDQVSEVELEVDTNRIDLKPYKEFQQSLTQKYGSKVSFKSTKEGGSIQFTFKDKNDLERLIARLA
jgi:ParB family chromosome partitioning protein